MSTTATPTTLPRLLRGVGTRSAATLDGHLHEHGELPGLRHRTAGQLADELERAGLRGRGGASFPAARKLRAVAARRGAKAVVVNATEGEPASDKDRVLLRHAPHLVLDGAAVAARAIGTREVHVAVSEATPEATAAIAAAIDERRARLADEPDFQLHSTPARFLAGQETALVNLINGGGPQPVFGARPYERGVRGRPTLVQNAETLAHMAMILRFGADWFRALGTERDPGSALLTLSGALEAPGVYEIEHGMALEELLEVAQPSEPPAAILIGGYFGSWLPASALGGLRLSPGELRPDGASLGAGVIVVLGRSACPVAETSRVADWFAAESAGQCGPCVHGLQALADGVQRLASGTATQSDHADLRRWTGEIPGRGACQHPDGAVRFLGSSLHAFAAEFRDHASHGPCAACAGPPVLPVGRLAPA